MNPSAVIQGASNKQDALKKLKEVGEQGFIRPVVCLLFTASGFVVRILQLTNGVGC